MIRFARTSDAPEVVPGARYAALVLAAVLVVMALGQLFTFEETVDLVARFGFLPNHASALSLMAVLATCEVMALPFLLRMRLSMLMRALSALCGWVVALLWLRITLAAVSNNLIHANIGFLGDKVPIPVGWWCVVYGVLLVATMAIVTWLFWAPYARHAVRKK